MWFLMIDTMLMIYKQFVAAVFFFIIIWIDIWSSDMFHYPWQAR